MVAMMEVGKLLAFNVDCVTLCKLEFLAHVLGALLASLSLPPVESSNGSYFVLTLLSGLSIHFLR